MITFVGAEYIIANLIIALNKTSISFNKLSDLDIYLKKMTIKKNIDIVCFTSQDQLKLACLNFPEYFICNKNNNTIYLNNKRSINDLKSRFIGYLPIDIIIFLLESIDEFVNNKV